MLYESFIYQNDEHDKKVFLNCGENLTLNEGDFGSILYIKAVNRFRRYQ